ncbi:MAG: tetratricopeptide repeat protein [Candidatus Coatesbacteria bacterium]|nr:MAG: tetratricopeptide repeat protein [Candidatus Coatesbacteria bacterium]
MKTSFVLTCALILAAAAGAGAHAPGEHAPGGPAEEAREYLLQRQPERAAALLQYALGHFPLGVELNLLYLDVLREEGLELLATGAYEERIDELGAEPILLYGAGRLAEEASAALGYYRRALDLQDDFAPAYVGLAEVYLHLGDMEAARVYAERALAADASYWRAYGLRGEIKLIRGEPEEALADFASALADDPYAPWVYAARAAAYMALGRAAEARDGYRRALAWSDDRGEYFLGLGRAQEELGEKAAARLAYEAAYERAYGNLRVGAEARKAAGRLAFEAGDFVAAAEYLGWAVAFMPDDAEVHAYLGGLYAHVGKRAEAAAEFKRAAELEPENVEYERLYNLALASIGEFKNAKEAAKEVVKLLMAGRREEALTELELGLEQYPLDTRLNLLYVDIVEEDGLTDEAREVYEGKLKRWGEEPIILVALGRLTAGTDLEEAESKYNRALEVGGPFAAAYVGLAEVGLRRGRAGHPEAEKYAKLSLATDGGYTRPYRIRGSICIFNDSLEDAVSNFKLALEGEPYDPVARGLLAQTYADLGNREAAVEEYRKAIYYNGSNYAYHWGLAGVLRYLRRYEEARQAYENAALYVKDDKLKARALDEAADLAIEEGNYSEAARYLAEAVKFSPRDRSLRLSLGRALAQQGKYDEAITELEDVLDRDPDDGYGWYELGLALEGKGDLVRAESALANAVRLLPDNTELRYPRAQAERKLAEVREALAEPEEEKAEE